jgi:hypothetical protein
MHALARTFIPCLVSLAWFNYGHISYLLRRLPSRGFCRSLRLSTLLEISRVPQYARERMKSIRNLTEFFTDFMKLHEVLKKSVNLWMSEMVERFKGEATRHGDR